jgi:hypothetical protein
MSYVGSNATDRLAILSEAKRILNLPEISLSGREQGGVAAAYKYLENRAHS